MVDIKTPSEIIKDLEIKTAKEREYKLVYDSTSQTLEPIYFWILDFMNKSSGKVEKLVDNFTSSPGSGHFSELQSKATRMQEEAMKIYGMVNTVIKSVINIIYDLKDFQVRLRSYDDVHSKDSNKKMAGTLSLKQVWMDQVDIKRGRGSINMLAQDLNFVTLRDAFMAVNNLKEVDKLDLNERVKRILQARLEEFLEWKTRSESELRKRFEIEKTYLRTQVDTLKMYSKWVKPYLVASEQLKMKAQDKYDADIVNVFNTIVLQLTIMGRSQIKVQEEALEQHLPEEFRKLKMKREYYSCVLIDFKFRGIPQRVSQQGHFAFGGRVEVSFKPYALNEEELKLLKYNLEKSDFEDSLKLVEGMTEDSLGQLKEDIDEFLKDEKAEKQKEYERINDQDTNPFAALFGFGNKKPKEQKEQEKNKKKEKQIQSKKDIKKDNYAEEVVRKYAEEKALESCYLVYDIYKKAHSMASTPDTA